jgi:hypothetical protein
VSHPKKSSTDILIYFDAGADEGMSKVVRATLAEWRQVAGTDAPKELPADFGNDDLHDTPAQKLTATLYARREVKVALSTLPDLAYRLALL